jgi:excisionase family DNA binding protein
MGMAPLQPRLARIVAALAYEYQLEQDEKATGRRSGRRRPEIRPYLDLTEYAHLTDKEVAKEIAGDGAWPLDWVTERINDERTGRYGDPATRCQTGLKSWYSLQCQRPALPGEQYCGHHHPIPPAPPLPPERLHPSDLALRPDGTLLRAIYDLIDRQRDLAGLITSTLDRLDRIEQRKEEAGPEMLTVGQAAELLGLSSGTIYRMCKQHRLPWLRVGGAIRIPARDLDTWLAKRVMKSVR